MDRTTKRYANGLAYYRAPESYRGYAAAQAEVGRQWDAGFGGIAVKEAGAWRVYLTDGEMMPDSERFHVAR